MRDSLRTFTAFLTVLLIFIPTSLALAESGSHWSADQDDRSDSARVSAVLDALIAGGGGQGVPDRGGNTQIKKPAVETVSVPWSNPERGCRGTYMGQVDQDEAVAETLACLGFANVCTVFNRVLNDGSQAVVSHRVDSSTGETIGDSANFSCVRPGNGGAGGVEAAPVVVTETEFASLGVEPLVAHLGPPVAMQIPTSMDVIVWAERRVQELHTELLGQDVTIRATPIKYVWTFGDGTELTTSFAGRPWPERDISMRYRNEGWYELSLTTEFAGEYSVAGGPFVPIDGTIHVTSEPRWLYANVMKARLVSGPVDPALNEIPERTEETLGKPNPKAKKTTLKYPGQNTKKKRR